jgi:hypothetical protein
VDSIFEKTYKNYLEQLREISFDLVAQCLGAEIKGNILKIALFKEVYNISHKKIFNSSGKKPSHDIYQDSLSKVFLFNVLNS